MLHKDFIMRQIQQAIQVLLQAFASVLKLKSEERYEEAIQRINEAFGKIELTPRPVRELSPDELIEMCSTPQGFDAELALSIADLLKEEGEMLEMTGEREMACASSEKSLALYRKALSTEGAAMPMDIHAKMSDVEGRIEDLCH